MEILNCRSASLTQAAKTKPCRLIHNSHLLLTVLEAAESKFKALTGLLCSEGPSPDSQMGVFSWCPHLAEAVVVCLPLPKFMLYICLINFLLIFQKRISHPFWKNCPLPSKRIYLFWPVFTGLWVISNIFFLSFLTTVYMMCLSVSRVCPGISLLLVGTPLPSSSWALFS